MENKSLLKTISVWFESVTLRTPLGPDYIHNPVIGKNLIFSDKFEKATVLFDIVRFISSKSK